MRITESHLRQIVREEIAAASPRSALGRYAFAEQRPEDFEEEPEPNNERENALMSSIIEHFVGGGATRLTEDDCRLIQGFLKKGMYSDVFVEPSVASVYRGMTVDESFVKSLGIIMSDRDPRVPSYQNMKPGGIAAVKNKKIRPLPGKFASSWTTTDLGTRDDSSNMAGAFASGQTSYGYQGGNVGIVLCADIAANPGQFFDAEPLYRLEGMPGVEEEAEAVGMGTIVCRKVYILKPE